MPRFNAQENQTTKPVVPETPKMTTQDANAKLSELVSEIYEKIRIAEAFADEHGLSFGLDVEYGMGGYYEEGGWHPSSQSC